MKTADRYVVREFAKALGLAVAVTLTLTLFFAFAKQTDAFREYGLGLLQLLSLAPFLIPYALEWSLPMAVLIAAIIAFGRMSSDEELTSLQAGGVSVKRIALPAILAGVVLSAALLATVEWGAAWGLAGFRKVLSGIDLTGLSRSLSRGGGLVEVPLQQGYVARINVFPAAPDGRKPIHVAIFAERRTGTELLHSLYGRDFDLRDEGSRRTEEGSLSVLRLRIRDGVRIGANPTLFRETELPIEMPYLPIEDALARRSTGIGPISEARKRVMALEATLADRERFVLDCASEFGAMRLAGSAPGLDPGMAAGVLWAETASAEGSLDSARRTACEAAFSMHHKIGAGLLPLAMVVLGVGLGMLVRRGQPLVGFVTGLLSYSLVYLPLVLLGRHLSLTYGVPPVLAACILPNGTVLAAGAVLIALRERGIEIPMLAPRPPAPPDPAAPAPAPAAGARLWRVPVPFLRKRMDRYVLGGFLTPLFAMLIVAVATSSAIDYLAHAEEVAAAAEREDLTILQVAQRVAAYYALQGTLSCCQFLPLILLAAAVVAATVMVRANEHLIPKAAGVSLRRVLTPVLLATALASLAVAALRETVFPDLHVRRVAMLRRVMGRSDPPIATSVRGWVGDSEAVLQVNRYDSAHRTATGLNVVVSGSRRRPEMIVADKARWDGNGWQFLDNEEGRPMPGRPAGYRMRFEEPPPGGGEPVRVREPMDRWDTNMGPSQFEGFRIGPRALAFPDLLRNRDIALWRREAAERLTAPLMGVILLMACLPLLMRQEVRSPLAGIGLALVVGGLYQLSSNAGWEAVERGQWMGFGFLPHLAFGAFGIHRYFVSMET